MLADAVARVGALRETIGQGVDIGVEIHRRLSPADAIVLAAELEQFRPLYYEDPIVPDSVESQAEVARAVRIPIATGERLNSLYEFRELLASRRRPLRARRSDARRWPQPRPRRSPPWPRRSTPA